MKCEPPRKHSTTEKKSVAEPASFRKFLVILIMHLCKKVLLINTVAKLGIYLCGASVVSLFTDLVPVPKSYFSEKTNFFNTFFVKLGWGWTISLLLPFVYYTSSTYCCGQKTLVRQHMARLGIATFFWYSCTTIFNWVENVTGMCTSAEMEHDRKNLCIEAGYEWIGFDASGHTFLLMYSLLVISEEVKCISGWSKIADAIKTEEEHPTRLTAEQLTTLKFLYGCNTPKIKGLIVCLTLLQILWEVMFFATVIYFHNMPQKLIAAAFASAVWLFTYQTWYRIEKIWPLPPGKGLIRYMVPP